MYTKVLVMDSAHKTELTWNDDATEGLLLWHRVPIAQLHVLFRSVAVRGRLESQAGSSRGFYRNIRGFGDLIKNLRFDNRLNSHSQSAE